ncbi:carboxylesterase family protein [Clostridium oryzae]|uniref:Phenmedipham hydrolase n=1 Tax=Clostridium oryzae TaxID=1450648 RepID=A0A1V4IKK2_9CLOT|nr:carboxylesterase family protein [Clostridium oryzae]OPJ60568.1 phenmedipham hydrolase [Clostridium oryzae]
MLVLGRICTSEVLARLGELANDSIKAINGEYADRYLSLFNVHSTEALEKVQLARIKALSMLSPRAWAKTHLKLHRKNPIYIYYFDRIMPGDNAGAFHSSELWYVFGTINRCWRPLNGRDFELSKIMSSYWTNFAKNGNPNGTSVPVWPAFTDKTPLTLRLSEKSIDAIDMSDTSYLNEMTELLIEEVYKNL